MGGLMMLGFILRFFVFHMYESPKYLMGRGRDAEAVEVIRAVAKYNGKETTLTVEALQEVEARVAGKSGYVPGEKVMDTSAKAAVRRTLNIFSGDHVRSLFATKKLAYSTTLLIILWGGYSRVSHSKRTLTWRVLAFIGLAFPLYNGFVTFLYVFPC